MGTTTKSRRPRPTIRPERDLASRIGTGLVAGIDEAGRGPIAGPVVAAAVVWDPAARRPAGITDSKLLSPTRRTLLARSIKNRCLAWGVGVCHAEEVDMINILEATRLASVRAVRDLEARLLATSSETRTVTALVTDALEIPALRLPTLAIVKGDQISVSVASASIIAKTTRDQMMDVYSEEFPHYGWKNNRGYPTEDHYAAVGRHGVSTIHRLTFRGVGFFCERAMHSRSFECLEKRISSACVEKRSIEALRAEVQMVANRLPPCELAELNEMLENLGRRLEAPALMELPLQLPDDSF